MATLHFICGKAGAGKTTLARDAWNTHRELGRSAPAVVICEDEWISTLGFHVRGLEQYLDASARCRALIASLVPELLRQGANVVLDFAGNTVKGRAWVRAFTSATPSAPRASTGARSPTNCFIRSPPASCLAGQTSASRSDGLS